MVARKRGRQEVEAEDLPQIQDVKEPTKLENLRNMWEFASFMQFIYIFGTALKIDEDFDIDELEAECLKPTPSEKLAQIGLILLKNVSSHKGLTPEIFDEYTRRQYVAKAPHRNPFGIDEVPNKFDEFDTFTKIRVLHQLSVWTWVNPNPTRERMPEKTDMEQIQWRIEPVGWDSDDRTYFVLDDDRLYRQTEPPIPSTPPKPKSKAKARKTTRGSKRRKLSTPPPESAAEEEEEAAGEGLSTEPDTSGGYGWECVAITLEDYQNFINSIRKSRDPNEKALVKSLEADVISVIEKKAEQQRAKTLRKQRELENLEKLAHAKRSGRIADRLAKQREQQAVDEAEKKRVAELQMARKEQEKTREMEEARESRMMTREQRLKEREVRRILHEEELRKLEENKNKAENNEARLSERNLKAELERRRKELEELAQEDDNWMFDCSICGVHGENLDDGSGIISCEKCNVWQHLACLGISKPQAERDDFHFVCADCQRKEQEAKRKTAEKAKSTAEETAQARLPPLKFRVSASASPKPPVEASPSKPGPPTVSPSKPSPTLTRHLDHVAMHQPLSQPSPNGLLNGPSLSPHGQSSGPPGIQRRGSGYGTQTQLGNEAPLFPPPQFHAAIPGANPIMTGTPQWQHSTFSHGQPYQPYPQGPSHVVPSPSRPKAQTPVQSSFEGQRPTSSGYGAPSPIKQPSFSSPYQSNGHPVTAPFSSPNTSFQPPHSSQKPSFSPVKQASSPPQQRSPSSQRAVDTSSDLLPEPSTGISPEKHEGPQPASSHDISETPVLPPVAPLAPSAGPTILTPPSKKLASDRPHHEALSASANTSVNIAANAVFDANSNANANAAGPTPANGAPSTQ